MRPRAVVVALVIAGLLAAAGLLLLRAPRAEEGHLTLVRRNGVIETIPAGTGYRRGPDVETFVVPLTGRLRFPADDSYRLFSREGAPVPLTFDIDWSLDGEEAARSFFASGATTSYLEGLIEAPLRRTARAVASDWPLAAIVEDGGAALSAAFTAELGATPGIRWSVRPAAFDRAAAEAALAALPSGGAGASGGAARPPILLVGIDALDGMLIDAFRAEGRLPRLGGLIDRGVRADLYTLTPMLSPLIWTSMATGVGPDRHGILDFLVTDPATGKSIPATSSLRRVPAFWNIATAFGRRVDVVGWLATWPAETVRGRIVSDRFGFLAYAAGTAGEPPQPDMVYPPGLLEPLRARLVPPERIEARALAAYVDADRATLEAARGGGFQKGNLVNNLVLTIATAESWTRIGAHFLAGAPGERADVTAVYFEFLDAVGHLFMPYAPPKRAEVTAADHARYRNAVSTSYDAMDRLLGELLDAAGDSTVVLVVSDHGFLAGDARPAGSAAIEGGQAARWHRNPGVLVMAGPGVREAARLPRAHVLDVTPTLLHLLGLPVSAEMEGVVLEAALRDDWRAGHPVRRVPRFELPPDVWAPPHLGSGAPAATSGGGSPGGAPPTTAGNPADSARAWVNLGLVLEQRGRLDDAEAYYRRALDAAPDDPNAANNLAGVLRRTGRTREAIALLEALNRRAPGHRPTLQNLGACWLELNEPEQALPWFDRALAAEPGNVLALTNRGHARFRLGRAAEAEADFREAIRLAPDTADAWFGLGLVAGTAGRFDEARSAFQRTLDLEPGHRSARENLGRIPPGGNR